MSIEKPTTYPQRVAALDLALEYYSKGLWTWEQALETLQSRKIIGASFVHDKKSKHRAYYPIYEDGSYGKLVMGLEGSKGFSCESCDCMKKLKEEGFIQ